MLKNKFTNIDDGLLLLTMKQQYLQIQMQIYLLLVHARFYIEKLFDKFILFFTMHCQRCASDNGSFECGINLNFLSPMPCQLELHFSCSTIRRPGDDPMRLRLFRMIGIEFSMIFGSQLKDWLVNITSQRCSSLNNSTLGVLS